MHPHFNNSRPYHSSQIQTDGTTGSSAAQQQVMPSNSNHCQGNPSNFMLNSAQIQHQMGIIKPQIAIPFNNSNGSISTPPSCFMNAPNQHFPLQNVMPPLVGPASALSHPGQFHSGFCPQNLTPIPMNQMNSSQPNAQFFHHNSMNLNPYLNQNVSLPYGQFSLPSPMQNMHQFFQMQMPKFTQFVPGNLPLYQNQLSQGMGPQNPTFVTNQQFGLVNSNGVVKQSNQEQHRVIPLTMDVNASKQPPNTPKQPQGNSSSQHAFGSVHQPQQTQNFRPPVFTKSQGNPRIDDEITNLNPNWKKTQNRNFTRHPKSETSRRGFMKSQFHHAQNAKGKFRFPNKPGGKGHKNDGARKYGLTSSSNETRVEKKRPLSLNYTEQEIQQWREERKKNYPSNANMEKKLTEKLTKTEVTDRDTMLRRQQLKEILKKQAELGCEVAEIPSYYLSDSEKQVHGREENKLASSKKVRFQNKYNKRGRFHQNDWFANKGGSADPDTSNVNDQNNGFTKKQRLANNDSSARPTINKREPTLLQKLLSADLRRDKSHLLQAFRFMVMNSFFKDCPEKPLRFPLVIVKETGGEVEVVEEKASHAENGVFEGSERTVSKECNVDGDYYNDETDVQVNQAEEEEGEIID